MGDIPPQVIGNRYRLVEQLGSGGMGVVYRAFDRLSQQSVALKQVVRPTDQLDITNQLSPGTTYTHLALAHEFQMLASLRHPNIISVLDYGFDEKRQPYFTMNLIEGARPITEVGQDKPLDVKVRLLIEMLQAIIYLHRRGIVHRDLKPDNALVTSEDQVKVLDFGISVKREQIKEESESDTVSGTFDYIAPEVLQGQRATEAADMYAVGVMAYELFAGQRPFEGRNITKRIEDILFTPVNVAALDLSVEIASILTRLLEKSPNNRYQDAHEVIMALSAAIDQPVPQETAAIRESFLQAAQFVGRDKELKQLVDALDQTTEDHGSTWLIGGESGVGKSRLLDELRTQALVKGCLVLQGQAVVEGGFSYHMWREPLRRLALSTKLNDLDAGTLKQILPGISDLLEREIPDVPELEGQAGQQRLLITIVNMFRQQNQPVVLILEDLHWAGDSLDVLRQLNSLTSDFSLLIIGSYRDDEKPNFARELPEMQHIKLDRLTQDGIAELSKSMLGEAGTQPQVLELLNKETEGNVFFLVEVVRALAEEAGWLGNIGQMSLPRDVFAGGIQQIVQRRLNGVPEDARSLLRTAALAGRQLDLALLRAIDSNIDVENWLTICSNAGVLDVMDEQWRFAHNKLRDGVLSVLDASERQTTHRQIAATLETVYADAQDEYAGTISDHYEQAGELARAANWHVKAGKHAEATYATDRASVYYRKALDYWEQNPDTAPQSIALQLEAYRGTGEILKDQARYGEATETFTAMRGVAEKADNRLAQAWAWRGLAAAQMYQGDFRTASEYLARAEEIARAADIRLELAKILLLRGWCQFSTGDIEGAQALGNQVLALSEEESFSVQVAESLNLLTAIHGTIGRYEQALRECERALVIYEEIGDRVKAMFQIGNLGMLAGMRGDHRPALKHFQDALFRARELGNRNAEMLYLNNLGGGQVMVDEFREAEENLQLVIQMSETTRFGPLSETYCFLAEALLGQGKIDPAFEAGQRGLVLGRKIQSTEFLVEAWRALGKIAARLNVAITLPDEAGRPTSYTASACFGESDRICRETGMEGARAITLRAWAQYELEQGDATQGSAMWNDARTIFERIGATLEAVRMTDMPAPRSS